MSGPMRHPVRSRPAAAGEQATTTLRRRVVAAADAKDGRAAELLASRGGGFITGQCLVVDGGTLIGDGS